MYSPSTPPMISGSCSACFGTGTTMARSSLNRFSSSRSSATQLLWWERTLICTVPSMRAAASMRSTFARLSPSSCATWSCVIPSL